MNKKFKIGFIGSGRVGITFGKYLVYRGLDILGYYSKTKISSIKGANVTNSKSYDNINKLILESNIIFITVNDDSISEVANKIQNLEIDLSEKYFIHMSGSLTINELKGIPSKNLYSLHPIMSFVSEDEKMLEDIFFSIESFEKSSLEGSLILEVLKIMGNKYFKISSEDKIKYHIASVFASNYLNAILDVSIDLFSSIGINEKEAFLALKPLINSSLNNIENFGTKNAITGPISRLDLKTVEKHIKEVNFKDIQYLNELYKILGKKTLEISKCEKLKEKIQDEKIEWLYKILDA